MSSRRHGGACRRRGAHGVLAIELEKNAVIYVAGGNTLIGRALIRTLSRSAHRCVSDVEGSPDLHDPKAVDVFMARTAPRYVIVAAGKSGGIAANQHYPVELMVDNLLTACHIIGSAYRHGVAKLLYLASSCVYPKSCAQPMAVDALLTGALESTSEAYALAKISGIKLCEAYRREYGANFISGIPADVFGPGDDFSAEDSHVVAGLMRRMHDAKVRGAPAVDVWGTGAPRRDFLFADDVADACLWALREYSDAEPINLSGGADVSIAELAHLMKEVIAYPGDVRFDASRPDGMPLKALDWRVLRGMGWRPKTPLRAALARTYKWFLTEAEGGGLASSRA